MRIAIDFDGTIVSQDREYSDLKTPLRFLRGAKEGLESLKAAGHELYLWSARANLALRRDYKRNPGWKRLKEKPAWLDYELNEARYKQMLTFVALELPGVFAWVDDGSQGKLLCDMTIDDRGYPLDGLNWDKIVGLFGHVGSGTSHPHSPEALAKELGQ